MTNQLIQFIALFLLMLVTGIFWGPWFSLHRKIHVFNASEFIHIVKTMSANLALPMRILMPLCVLFLFLTVWLSPQNHAAAFYLQLTAACLIVVSLLITVVVEVPIVSQINSWTTTTLPDNWQAIRNRWVKFHVVRTFAALISFGCLTASVLFFQ